MSAATMEATTSPNRFAWLFNVRNHEYWHLGSKHDNDFRHVNIRLSTPSVVLLGIVFIASIFEYETMKALAKGIWNWKPSRSGQTHRWLSGVMYPLLMLFPILYSFEMLFLYYNDQWLQLWLVQLCLTVTDALVWVYYLAVVNYQVVPHSTATQAAVSIKSFHILFNLHHESKRMNLRNMLFLAEDLGFCLICEEVFQFSRKKRQYVGAIGTGAFCLLVTTLYWRASGTKWSVK